MEAIEALVAAVKAQDLETVQRMVEAAPMLPTMRTAAREEPLMTAIYIRARPIIEFLRTKPGGDSFFASCALGDVAAVKASLNGNPGAARVTAGDGHTPLGLASFFGHQEVAALLLAAGADVNMPSQNAMAVSPIHSAVATKMPAMVRALIAAGANVNARQAGGITPLHQAAHGGQTLVLDMLLEAGAEPAARADNGRTALDYAREGGHAECVARLEALGMAPKA